MQTDALDPAHESLPSPTAGIITVGDEILAGRIQDTLSAQISRELVEVGYDVVRHVSVGDGPGELSAVLVDPTLPVLIITGGLGPTEDDRTRGEVATAAGVSLEFREDCWRKIEEIFRARNLRPVEGNRRQAWFPAGAEVIPNSRGTAPGFRVSRPGGSWFVLPGVPTETEAMLHEAVIPSLRADAPRRSRPAGEVLRFFGVAESRLDTWLLERIPTALQAEYHIRVASWEIEVHLPGGLSLAEECQQRFGSRFLGIGGRTLAERVLDEACGRGLTLGTVESCTGGAVASRLTEVPGASRALAGAWVVYSNSWKERRVGVPPEVLRDHGAVSAECARALAAGGRTRGCLDLCVAVTGIAGPDGGTPEKPVGTTFVALADDQGTLCRGFQLAGSRDQVRSRAVAQALYALWGGARRQDLHGWDRSPPG